METNLDERQLDKGQVIRGLIMELGRVEAQRQDALTRSRMNKEVTKIVMDTYSMRMEVLRRAIGLLAERP